MELLKEVSGLFDSGMDSTQIAKQLGIRRNKVEAVLELRQQVVKI
jgi:hypothetical protein